MQNKTVIEHLNNSYLGDGRINVGLELPWVRQQQSLRAEEMEEEIEEGVWSFWLFAEKSCQCLVLSSVQVDTTDCSSFPQKPNKSLNGRMGRRTLVVFFFFYNEVKENTRSVLPHRQVPF